MQGSGGGSTGTPAAPADPEPYGDKLEVLLHAIAAYLQQLAATLALLFLRPVRAGVLLRPGSRINLTPPLGFLVTGYFTATFVGSLNADIMARAAAAPDSPVRAVSSAVRAQLDVLDATPLKVILLAFPVVLGVIAISAAAAALLRVDRREVIALCSYSTGFAWYFLSLGVLGFDAVLVGAAILQPGDGPLYVALGIGVLLLLWGAAAWLTQIVVLAASAARFRRGVRRLGTFAALCLTAAVCGGTNVCVVLSAFESTFRQRTRLDATVHVSSLEFTERDYVRMLTYADTSFDRDPAVVPLDTILGTPGTAPVSVLVLLRNRSDSTIVIRRLPASSGANFLEIGLDTERDGRRYLSCRRSTNLAIEDWAAGADPVLILGKGEVKWIRLTGTLLGYSSIAQIRGFRVKVRLRGEDVFLESPWQEVFQEQARDWSTEPATFTDLVQGLPECRESPPP
jgi:hypothetical protein